LAWALIYIFETLHGHHTKHPHCPSHPGLKADKEDKREAAKATTWAAATGSTLLDDPSGWLVRCPLLILIDYFV